MIWIVRIVMGIIGLAGGIVIAAGVFALVTSTGMMSRLAARTNTSKKIMDYETAVVAGGTIMNVLYIYFSARQISLLSTDYWNGVNDGDTVRLLVRAGIAVGMTFAGMFVGCLAVSLSEAVKATAIFARRMRLNSGMCYIVLAATIGKALAIIIQFIVK